MSDYTPAADAIAEFALLATLIHADQPTREALFAVAAPGDFYTPSYAELALIVAGMGQVDPALVMAEAQKSTTPQRESIVRLLPNLVTYERLDIHAELYARRVDECARRRRLQELGQRISQQASAPDADVTDVTIGVIEAAESLIVQPKRSVEPSQTIDEFLDGPMVYDWIIPGLLEREDRMILTGFEGSGKSVLLRQIAFASAAGLHPVSFEPIKPLTVLIVDLEYGKAHLRRSFAAIRDVARRDGDYDPQRIRIESRPSGIDIADPSDAAWLAGIVEAASPDLLTIGPLYRLHKMSLDKEDAAREVTVFLDGLRSRSRCALIVEAHSGHGNQLQRGLRPTGSSLFMRWPEFGMGLRPKPGLNPPVKVIPWRGARDDRAWPEMFRRGGHGTWPWIETIDEVEDGWAS